MSLPWSDPMSKPLDDIQAAFLAASKRPRHAHRYPLTPEDVKCLTGGCK